MFLKVLDELRSEGDFGDKENYGLLLLDCGGGEREVDVGFAGASDAVE